MGKNKRLAFFNKSKNRFLALDVVLASSFLSRFRGLLAKRELKVGEGLYLLPCNQIHMFGMAYAIDVVFINKQGLVVGLSHTIKPGQVSPIHRQAIGCLELLAGTISDTGTELGDEIIISEKETESTSIN